jgi:hypothetical protein
MEKAALKRQRRLARKQGIEPETETRSEDGHDPGEPRPTIVLAPPPENESKP